MLISIIAAMGHMRQIGMESRIPWHLPADLKQFKNLTMGHHVIFGRKTYESLGRPLPGRKLIIVSRDKPPASIAGVAWTTSLDEAIAMAKDAGETECFIGGGGQIYAQALDLTHRIYLSRVDFSGAGDVFFPELDAAQWTTEHEEHHEKGDNAPAWVFEILKRK